MHHVLDLCLMLAFLCLSYRAYDTGTIDDVAPILQTGLLLLIYLELFRIRATADDAV